MISLKERIVLITGASAGIGAACATGFASHGARLLLAARRKDRLERLASVLRDKHGTSVHSIVMDVRDNAGVRRSIEGLPEEWKAIDILVNNAGLSRGLAKLHEGATGDWDEMVDTNVKGLLYVTRAVLPSMVRRNSGHIINIGSIAGNQTYPGGNVYSATKFAVRGITESLRMDLLGTAVRVSSVDPGLVKTEFSLVRFRGDSARAAKTYEGMTPLSPTDVADAVLFCATRPTHVTIASLTLMSIDQASVTMVNRRTP